MPLVGVGHSLNLVGDEAPYFTSLEELDSWMDKPSRKLRSVLPYAPRSKIASPSQQGQLLVSPTTSSWNVRPRYSYNPGLSRLQGKTTPHSPLSVSSSSVNHQQGGIHRKTLGTLVHLQFLVILRDVYLVGVILASDIGVVSLTLSRALLTTGSPSRHQDGLPLLTAKGSRCLGQCRS